MALCGGREAKSHASWWTFALTVVSEQRLSRALALGAGGFRAAPAVEANTTVGATVAPRCPMAAVYAPLARHWYCRLSTSPKKTKAMGQ